MNKPTPKGYSDKVGVPRESRCVDISAPGGPEVLVFKLRETPQPNAGEVLIRVNAAGVNRADVKQRLGIYHMPPDAPTVPGVEVAGVIVKCGPEVSQWKPGDRVCALVVGGGYAEYCLAPAIQCLPIPDTLNFIDAAALPETLLTVWSSLIEQARLQPGERVLIHGGASGVGTTAIQLAYRFGAQVFATAGTDEKCALAERLGAVRSFNYRTGDFSTQVKSYVGEAGIDVVLDMVGSAYLQRHLDLLAMGGRLCFISPEHGREASIDIQTIQLKRLFLTGSTLRHRDVIEKGRIVAAVKKRVWPLVAQKKIAPVIWRTFSLENAVEAHRQLEAGNVLGKAILMTDNLDP